MERYRVPARYELSEDQRRVYDSIVEGPRGAVVGPLAVWLEAPLLADRAQSLGAYCRFESSLAPRHSELAILVVASFWKSGLEWNAHAALAREAGIAAEIIANILAGEEPVFEDTKDRIIWRFATELLASKRISEALWQEARELLGQRAIVDLVGVLGYYTLISMTINTFEIDPGPTDPFGTRNE